MADEKTEDKKGRSVLELISAGTGFVVALAMIGFMGWKAVTGGDTGPPEVSLTPARFARAGENYVVEFVARNAGLQTAADVHVEGTLLQGTHVVERSGATLDYVPARSERHGGIVFVHNPRRFRLEVRPTGYQVP